MPRQAVFMVGLVLAGSGILAAGPLQEQAASKEPSPPAAIPLSRLTADAVIPLAFEPGAVAVADGLWVPQPASGSVVKVDAKRNTVGQPVHVGGEPCASLVHAFDSLWVPLCGAEGGLLRLPDPKPADPKPEARSPEPEARSPKPAFPSIASAVGSIWLVTDRKGVVARVDPDTNAPVAEIYVPRGAASVNSGSGLFSGADALWVTSEEAGRLTRVNPHNNVVEEEIRVGPKPVRLAVGEGGVWTLNGDGTVTRVDPKANKVVATIALGVDTTRGDIAAGAGSVWVSVPGAPVVRIDPRTNRATHRFTGEGGGAILVAHGSLWVNAGAKATWRLDPRLVEAVRP
ncbi:MAG: hypothetical protein AB1635_08995 [Acidobacteriota bacterium]